MRQTNHLGLGRQTVGWAGSQADMRIPNEETGTKCRVRDEEEEEGDDDDEEDDAFLGLNAEVGHKCQRSHFRYRFLSLLPHEEGDAQPRKKTTTTKRTFQEGVTRP
jgi:hypothetical protein